MENQNYNSSSKIKVLNIDGGGIRGVRLTNLILKQIFIN
jgi:hypothetical protein